MLSSQDIEIILIVWLQAGGLEILHVVDLRIELDFSDLILLGLPRLFLGSGLFEINWVLNMLHIFSLLVINPIQDNVRLFQYT